MKLNNDRAVMAETELEAQTTEIIASPSNKSRRLVLNGILAGVGSLALAACGGNDDSGLNSVNDSARWRKSGSSGKASSASTASSTSAASSTAAATTTAGTVVPASFFGMHYSSAMYKPWPGVTFSTLRTWDQWPGVAWSDLNPSNGVYNWANLDAVVNAAVAKGVDIVYTFGYVPAWASTNASGACSGNMVGSCYQPDLTAWKNFVTQITNRYKGKIKYWELWNEPNAQNFWLGTTAQMVTMASAAYGIIKSAGGTVLSPAPQGTNAHVWLDAYFAAGGAACTDIVAFHGYLAGAPELIGTLVTNLRTVMAKYNLSSLPLWDTEHSWGDSSWPFGATTDQQSAWLARYLVLSFTNNIARSIWYMYDSTAWGMLSSQTSGQMLATGVAYQQIYKWMEGATLSPCTVSADVYQCALTRTSSNEAIIVWNDKMMDGQTVGFTPPAGYTQYQTLDGETLSIVSGAQVQIGMKPVLIEKG